MRKTLTISTSWFRALFLAILVIAGIRVWAQQQTIPVYDKDGGLGCVVVVDSIKLSKADSLGLTLTLGLADNALPKTDMVMLTPRLFTATDSIDFPSLRLYGKWAYIALQRSGNEIIGSSSISGNSR